MRGRLMAAEMAQQPEVLSRLVERATETRAQVAAVIPDPLRGVSLVARGSSDNAAVYGRYLCELSAGVPAGLIAPSIHTRYAAHVDYRGQLVVGLSQSGATPEIIDTCERLREAGARVISVTNVAASPLAAAAELSLSVEAGPELAVPATKTVTAQMLTLALIASALGTAPFAAGDLARVPDAVEDVLADHQPAADLASAWADSRGLVVVARGLMLGAAMETALKIRETAGIHAEGISAADLLHGPIAALDDELPVLVLRAGGPGDPDLDALVQRLRSDGVPTVQWEPSAALPESLEPIVATVRGHQLALAWAQARGRDPDAPVGLSKVTATR